MTDSLSSDTGTSSASPLSFPDGDDELSTLLRVRTRPQHSSSDRLIHLVSPFILSSPRIYRLLLKSFYHVYKELEDEIEQRRLQYPKIAPIYFRELRRTGAFEQDLDYYFQHDPSNKSVSPSPATETYLTDMRKAVDSDPLVLIAYSHTLYMALLSGGLIFRGWVSKALNLPSTTDSGFEGAGTGGSGVAIFDFSPAINDVGRFKQNYLDAVNSIALTPAQKLRIVQRTQHIFKMNNQLIKEVCWSSAYRHKLVSVVCKMAIVIVVVILVWSFFTSKRT